ncbi:MAG: insulinase family protein [Nannocystaceae bacterium]
MRGSNHPPLARARAFNLLVALVALAGRCLAGRGLVARAGRCLVVLAVLIAVGALAPETARADEPWTTFAGDPIGAKVRRLDNGFTVVISENHEVPRVFGAVVVRAGGKNDPAHATGIAHYLEHMLFKGTASLGTIDHGGERPHLDEIEALYEALRATDDDDERAEIFAAIDRASQAAGRYAIPGELDRVLQQIGSSAVNAFTTPDITVYHNEFPARSIDRWIAVYGHRFQEPVFRLFPSELETVYEEKNRSMDGLEPVAEAFLAKFFRAHPYGTQSVLGSVDHLKRPSLKEMYAFYRRHYVAGNMALVLAGDVDADAIWPVIDRYFGTWPNEPVPKAITFEDPPFRGREEATIRMTPVRALGLGFRLPPEGHPDYAAVLVINELLTNEQEAGLLDRLADDGEVLIARAVPIPLNDVGVGLIAVIPRIITQTFAGAERRLLAALAKVRGGDFSDVTLAAVRRAALDRYRRRWESNEDRALALVEAFGRGQSWQATLDTLDRLAKVDRAQVMAAAERYYGDDYLALRSRVGFPDKTRLKKPPITAVQPAKAARSSFAAGLDRIPERPTPLRLVVPGRDIERASVAPGVTLERNQNPFNDLYTLELRHGVGHYDVRLLSVLDEYLGDVGTQKRDGKAFKEALFNLATTLTVQSTEEALVLRLEGPEEHLEAALDLLGELLRGPAEDRGALRRLRRERWGLRQVDRRQPRVIADALREYVTFGDASTYLREYSPRQLLGVRPRHLIAALREAQGYEATIRYVGRRSAAEVAGAVRGRLEFRDHLAPARPKVVRDRIDRGRDRVFWVKRRQSVQTQVYLLVEGDPVPLAERPAAAAYNEYLGGGMAGLVFHEIRELRALAYSARGEWYESPVAGKKGVLLAYLATQADKTAGALEVLSGLLDHLPDGRDQMEGLRAALIRSHEAAQPRFRELQGEVARWRWLGYHDDPRRTMLPALREVTWEDVRAFHERQVVGRPRTLMIVGDPRQIDEATLERYGEVEVVRSGALFSR